MVWSTKENVHLLQGDLPRFWNEEDDVDREEQIDPGEEEEGVTAGLVSMTDMHSDGRGRDLQAALGEESREELLEDDIGDVLRLRAHADGLRAHIHGEDL